METMPIGDCPTFHSVIRVIAINNEFYRKDVLMRLFRETKNRKTDTDDIATAKLFGNVNDWVLQQDGAKPHLLRSCYRRESWTGYPHQLGYGHAKQDAGGH